MRKTLLSITSLALSALLFPLQGIAGGTNAFKGHELFGTYCFVCHGTEGKGDGPLASKMEKSPANLTDKTRMSKRSEKDLFQIVKGTDTHMLNGAMPQWGRVLSDPDINALVAYLHFLSNSAEALPGDPHMGEDIYENSCSACHGEHGRGDGVMANILPMKPADHTRTGIVSKISNQQLIMTITEGRGDYMPGWNNLLSEEEIAAVASYIRLLSY